MQTFTVTGGSVISYSLVGILPRGLTFNTVTGVISGTPAAVTSDLVLTAKLLNNGSEIASTMFSIRVEPEISLVGPTQIPTLSGVGAKSDPYSATGGAGQITLSLSTQVVGGSHLVTKEQNRQNLNLLKKEKFTVKGSTTPNLAALPHLYSKARERGSNVTTVLVPGNEISLDSDGSILVGASVDVGTYLVTVTATDAEGNNSDIIATVRIGPAISNIADADIRAFHANCGTRRYIDGIAIAPLNMASLPGFGPGYDTYLRAVFPSGHLNEQAILKSVSINPLASGEQIVDGLEPSTQYYVQFAIADVTGAEKVAILNYCDRTTESPYTSVPEIGNSLSLQVKDLYGTRSGDVGVSHFVDGFYVYGKHGNLDDLKQYVHTGIPFTMGVEIRAGSSTTGVPLRTLNYSSLEQLDAWPFNTQGFKVETLTANTTYYLYITLTDADGNQSFSTPTIIRTPSDLANDYSQKFAGIFTRTGWQHQPNNYPVVSKYYDGLELDGYTALRELPQKIDGTKAFNFTFNVIGTYPSKGHGEVTFDQRNIPMSTEVNGATKISIPSYAQIDAYVESQFYGGLTHPSNEYERRIELDVNYGFDIVITDSQGFSNSLGGGHTPIPNPDLDFTNVDLSVHKYLDAIVIDSATAGYTNLDGTLPYLITYEFWDTAFTHRDSDTGSERPNVIEQGTYTGEAYTYTGLTPGHTYGFMAKAWGPNTVGVRYTYVRSVTSTLPSREVTSSLPRLSHSIAAISSQPPFDYGFVNGFIFYWNQFIDTDHYFHWTDSLQTYFNGNSPFTLSYELSKLAGSQWETPQIISYKDCGIESITGFYRLSMNTLCKVTGLQPSTTYKLNLKIVDDQGVVTRGDAMQVTTKGRYISDIPVQSEKPRIPQPYSNGLSYTNKIVISKLADQSYFENIPLALRNSESYETETVFDLSFNVRNSANQLVKNVNFEQPQSIETYNSLTNLITRLWNGSDEILVPNPVEITGLIPDTDYYITFVVSEKVTESNPNPSYVESEILHIKTAAVTAG